MTNRKAFTLIELLIVVAIIAILAAIAVPNFLEAQTRSKVSRTKADIRSMATALETYYVDSNAYPQCNRTGCPVASPSSGDRQILERISTPVAYMTSVLVRDPFEIKGRQSAGTAAQLIASTAYTETEMREDGEDVVVFDMNSYIYQSWCSIQRTTVDTGSYEPELLPARGWLLHSAGPDGYYHNLGGVLSSDFSIAGPILLIYDPTNGTVSRGSIYRFGGSSDPGFNAKTNTNYAAGVGLRKAYETQR